MNVLNPYLELSYPLFEIALLFTNGKEEQGSNLHQISMLRFDEFERNCNSKNLSVEDVQSVKYALTAFIDELALGADHSHSNPWLASPLQLEFFGEHMAGEGFFNKLTLLRQQANADVLEIYFLCLQLGFSGIYAMENTEKLKIMLIDLRSQLDGLRKETQQLLSVDVLPKAGVFQKSAKVIPTWIFASVFTTFIFVFYFGFSLVMDLRVKQNNKSVNDYYSSHVKVHYKKLIKEGYL